MTAVGTKVMSRAALEAMAGERGFSIETFATTIPETAPPRGYTLRGPRGNKRVLIAVDDQGGVSQFEVTLWWDGVVYANQRAAEAKAKRVVGRGRPR